MNNNKSYEENVLDLIGDIASSLENIDLKLGFICRNINKKENEQYSLTNTFIKNNN